MSDDETRMLVSVIDASTAQRLVTQMGWDYVFPNMPETTNKILYVEIPGDAPHPADLYHKMFKDFCRKNKITPLFEGRTEEEESYRAFLPASTSLIDLMVPAALLGGKLAEVLKQDILKMPPGKQSERLQ